MKTLAEILRMMSMMNTVMRKYNNICSSALYDMA